jgi:hypothetical protein
VTVETAKLARSEMVEKELDTLIRRRDGQRRQTEGERRTEELWAESAARYNEQRRLQARYEWHLYHVGQAERHRRTLEELVRHHETEAAKLLGEDRGEGGP